MHWLGLTRPGDCRDPRRFAEQTAGAAFRDDPQYHYVALTTTF
jgi:hypothetical protein